ncbi:MAG: DUF4129 domain-containing protein [Haloferacaceae archaeon]
MNRNAALTVALAALAVLALALAAATLDSAVVTEGGGRVGLGPNDSPNVGGSNERNASGLDAEPLGGRLYFDTVCYPVLKEPWVVGLLLLGFALVAAAGYRSTNSWLPAAALVVALGIPTVMLYSILTACGTADSTEMGLAPLGGNGTSFLPQGGGGSGGLGGGSAVSTPTSIFGVLLVVALIGAVVLLFVSTGDDESPPEDVGTPEPNDVARQEAIGAVAGQAADRIEETDDLDNEVYRAWVEMTRHLDVPNPEASTPSEFATAAVDAGMAREDVDDLTAVFEEVRYGGAAPTAERERRAVEALRRIESEYATDGDAGGDPSG